MEDIKRIKKRNRDNERYHRFKNEVYKLFNNKCANPYNIDHSTFEQNKFYIYCLQIDHINGGGRIELDIVNNRVKYYMKIIKSIKENKNEYQLLCANCNWIKLHVNNEFQKIGGVR